MLLDYVVIGGGIVGVSTAMHLLEREPGSSLVLLDKEPDLARHQTGRNSGVIHAGVYYAPGSLKARFSKEGAEATIRFAAEHGVPFERCGKLLVATSQAEMQRMQALEERCRQNEIAIERLDAAELKRREPHITGLGALFVRATGIVDYGLVTRKMADVVRSRGGEIRTGMAVTGIREEADGVTVVAGQESFRTGVLVVCAGLMADRLARLCGVGGDFQIVPFRGEYYRLPPDKNNIVKHLIYPIPDPSLPFLGVHLTRMIGGFVTVGPNAVFSFKREGYSRYAFDLKDTFEALSFVGTWNVLRKHGRSGLDEFRNSLSRRRYLELCRKYCPELTVDDLGPHPSGVRAQAVLRDGTLVHDFLIKRTARTIHICNAPSPAATSAIPIGQHVAEQAQGIMAEVGGGPRPKTVPASSPAARATAEAQAG
jgi:(S)-2-hydroxyglutarate dehydrogenase